MSLHVVMAVALTGFAAMVSQIVLVRELLIVFAGNELSFGLILASWLLCGAAGSFLSVILSKRLINKLEVFVYCLTFLSFSLPVSVTAVRSIRTVLGMNPGEIMPMVPIAAASLFILLPSCMTIGFIFSLAARSHKPEPSRGAVRIGEVYIFESIGSMSGGLIASSILIRYFSPTVIMALLGALLISAAIMLMRSPGAEVGRKLPFWPVSIALLIHLCLWAFNGWAALDRRSTEIAWKGSDYIASRNSVYGNITVTGKGPQRSFFDNGLHLYTLPDKRSAEESVNFALLEHPAPKRVLLIGGGSGGLLAEIARHPVEQIDYLELDPLIIEMARSHLPLRDRMVFSDRRVSLIFEDGRHFVKRAREKYDVIIVSLGDPYTAQINRYYTLEFFNETKRIMSDGGVLSFGLSASESYIGRELADFLRSIYATLKGAYPYTKVIPGETAYFLASNADVLTYDYKLLMDRAAERGLNLKFVREYYLYSKLSPDLIGYTDRVLSDRGNVRMNLDFKPASYYYGIIAWTSRFRDSYLAGALKVLDERILWSLAVLVFIAILLYGYLHIRRKKTFAGLAMVSVWANGYTQMAFQIVTLISFQMIYGFIFYKAGVMMTAFMAGIAAGCGAGNKWISGMSRDASRKALAASQLALLAYSIALVIILSYLSASRGMMTAWIGSNLVFPVLPLVSGLIGGFIFSLANSLCMDREDDRGRVAGVNYGLDLASSCIGALVTGAFLIPVLGISGTCMMLAALNLKVLIVLIAGVLFT